MKKRILSILLLCCMVLTLLPTAAFAEGEIPDSTNVTVTFDSNGGGEVESQTIQQGQQVQRPADPVKEGYHYYQYLATVLLPLRSKQDTLLYLR